MRNGNAPIWWRLSDAWENIRKNIPLQFIPFAGIVFSVMIMADEIGVIIKFHELKKQMRDDLEVKNFFKNYLIAYLVPFAGPFFYARVLNDVMAFLEPHGARKEDIEYIEKKGKDYAYLGLVAHLFLFGFLAVEYVFMFAITFALRYHGSPSGLALFFVIFFACWLLALFIITIIWLVMKYHLLEHLISGINSTKLIEMVYRSSPEPGLAPRGGPDDRGEGTSEFCPNCGMTLRPGTRFCPNCGRPV